MAINENVCWFVLRRAHNKITMMSQQIAGSPRQESRIENGVGIGELEKELVLRYSKSDIEDSLYFLEKRGYLSVHGFGLINPRLCYSLKPEAIDVIDAGSFTDEEKEAFDASLLFTNKNDEITTQSKYPAKLIRLMFKWMSSYGESPLRVAITALLVIFACTVFYAVSGLWSNALNETVYSVPTSAYFSVVTFTTLGYGDFSPITGPTRIVAAVEAVSGLFLMSLFLVTLVRRFGRD